MLLTTSKSISVFVKQNKWIYSLCLCRKMKKSETELCRAVLCRLTIYFFLCNSFLCIEKQFCLCRPIRGWNRDGGRRNQEPGVSLSLFPSFFLSRAHCITQRSLASCIPHRSLCLHCQTVDLCWSKWGLVQGLLHSHPCNKSLNAFTRFDAEINMTATKKHW